MKNRFARRALSLVTACFLVFPSVLMAEEQPDNSRKAYEHLSLVLDSKPKGNIPTREFLQFCELAAATQPHLSVEEAIIRLDKLSREDVTTFEKANLSEIALAFGSLKVAGKSADAAVPALLKIVAPKSNDAFLGSELSSERYRALQRRLRVFRYAAIACLNDINLNQHPESLGAILDIFQRQLRIADYSETSSWKSEIKLIKTAFSRIDGSNSRLLPEIIRGLEFEFNGRLYLLKARKKKAAWHEVYDSFITSQLFMSAAKYQSQSSHLARYAFLYLERGGQLALPVKSETESIGGAITRYLIASQPSALSTTERLFSILERVANENAKKKSTGQMFTGGEPQIRSDYQNVLLRILSKSPQNHPAFLKSPFREIVLRGLNNRSPSIRAASAMLVAQLGEKGMVFVPALINSLKLRNDGDYLLDEQLHASLLYGDMMGPRRSLMSGHNGKDGRTNATLETIRALGAIGPKAIQAKSLLETISNEQTGNSNAPWRIEAKETLRKIKISS